MATEHFTDDELRCRCGCGGLPPQSFQDELEALRVAYGHPMRISSGYRCPDYNDKVSSTGRDGPHSKGAVDVLVSGRAAWQLIYHALYRGWRGIGVSQKGEHARRFIHLDNLDQPARPWVWSY